jgi:trimeric autotransporter adhesin
MTHGARAFSGLFFAVLSLSSLLAGQQTGATLALPSTGVPRVIQFNGSWSGAKSGIVGFTFAIYKDQEGGAPLWMETQNLQLDGKGHYTALLGSTKTEGLPPDIFASGEARWVGITANGEKEQPRVLLVAVPYALHAANAETVGGLPSSAFVLTPQFASSGVNGTPSLLTQPILPGKKSKSSLSTALTGTGTLNFLPLWTPDGSTLGNSALFQAAGPKIGIDTQTPATKLDVNGATTIRGTLKLPAVGAATAAAGKNSRIFDMAASAFNTTSLAAEDETFVWQVEPVNNNTATPTGSLNLLFAHGAATPAETGLSVSSSGILGATFTGTVGSALEGRATATGNVSASGVEGIAAGDIGSGVVGIATGATGHGVEGVTSADTGTGVVGVHNNLVGAGVGVSGTTSSPLGTGVLGVQNNGAATGFGVRGSSSNGVGVAGNAVGGKAGSFANSSATNPSLVASNTLAGPIFQAVSNGSNVMQVGPTQMTFTAVGNSTMTMGNVGCNLGFVGISLGGALACNGYAIVSNGTDTILNRSTGGRLDFREGNSATQMSIAAGGKVGIGTATPAFQLDVLATAGANHAPMSQFGSSGAHDSNSVLVYNSSGFAEVFAVGNASNFVKGSAVGDGGLRVNAAHKILFGDLNAARMTIDASGNVSIKGSLSKGSGSFKIDHPLDPANKYLYHSFVESPDMMNVYNGNITTDRRGLATVVLPDYFEALNRDFRYQLTVIGQFAQAIVEKEITNNSFVIKTSRPGVKVSWQVTGVRHDAYAEAHRIQVEEEKTPQERGHYLHPELFGAQPELATEADANPGTVTSPH